MPCLALFAPSAGHAAVTDIFATLAAPAGAALHQVADAKPMRVVLTLPLRDEAGAQRYAQAVSDPASALYGKHLTAAQFGARFGADAASYESLRSWATSNGLTAGARTASRSTLSLAGTAGQFARLFNTRFASFQTAHNGLGRLTTVAPRLPADLAGRVDGVVGLTSGGQYAPLYQVNRRGAHTNSAGGSGVGGAYAPADFRTAYDVPAQTSATPTEVVAIFEQGGFKASDVTAFESQYGLPAATVTPRGVNGSGTSVVDEGVELEAVLDIDCVLSINPAVKQIIVYEDSYLHDDFGTAIVDSLNLIAQDNVATTVSISYGQDEAQQGVPTIRAEGRALVQLAVQGQTVYISSGDDGAYGREFNGLNAPDPGSQPLATSVGGTTLYTLNTDQQYLSEQVWNQLGSGLGATGGGVSAVWKIPFYQKLNGTSVAVTNGGSATMRNVPDIAADGDPSTSIAVYSAGNGGWVQVGGTSESAPLWAGFNTIINAERVAAGLPRVGFFNPLLYKLGVAGNGFHDVTDGSNGNKNLYGIPGYEAGYGYDNSTGFGSLDLASFLPSVTTKKAGN